MTKQLPPAHHRALTAMARNVKHSIDDIRRRLDLQPSANQRLRRTYSDDDRRRLLHAIDEIDAELNRLMKEFGLHITEIGEEQILAAHAAHLWALLQDSRPEKLSGYGHLDAETAAALDKSVLRLLEQVERLQFIVDENG